MDVSTLQRLDANILLGIINEKLRLERSVMVWKSCWLTTT